MRYYKLMDCIYFGHIVTLLLLIDYQFLNSYSSECYIPADSSPLYITAFTLAVIKL